MAEINKLLKKRKALRTIRKMKNKMWHRLKVLSKEFKDVKEQKKRPKKCQKQF